MTLSSSNEIYRGALPPKRGRMKLWLPIFIGEDYIFVAEKLTPARGQSSDCGLARPGRTKKDVALILDCQTYPVKQQSISAGR